MSEVRFRRLSSLADVAPLRAQWLASLTALPELFVEANVRNSVVFAIERNEVVGYVTVLDGTLTEWFLAPEHRAYADDVLRRAIGALGLRKAWATTFDPLALAVCRSVSRAHTVLGYSFREQVPVALPTPDPLPTERIATKADVALVRAANHPDVFDDLDDIPRWVDNGWVRLFEFPDDVAGFGLATPTGPETVACDIGIRVCTPYQRRGLGAWIAQRMAQHAQRQGLVATAGCDADNAVSRRTLERAGFVADHRLLEFEL